MNPITLATLPQASAQEVFDFVCHHLLTQEQPSTDAAGNCVYHSLKGTKCAAGCLIEEGEYIQEMEKTNWSRLVVHGLVPEAHQELICHLQYVHDDRAPEDWKEALRKVPSHLALSDCISLDYLETLELSQ